MATDTTSRSGLVLLARNGSSRLPGKSLLPLGNSTVLDHQVERLRRARKPDVFMLATTTRPEDDTLCHAAERLGLAVFRGSPHDVLRRLGDASSWAKVHFIAVVGGDGVLCDGESVDDVIVHYEQTDADFITVAGMPSGMTPFGVRVAALERVLDLRADEASDGWERFFTDTGLFRCRELPPRSADLNHPAMRVDLDYPEDYQLLQAVYERLYDGTPPDQAQVLRLLQDDPTLAALNHAAHAKWLANRASAWPPLVLKAEVVRDDDDD